MAIDLNFRAALTITRVLPGVGERTIPVTIWWRGASYRVHGETGAPPEDFLALAADPGGLGRLPRTKEDIMNLRLALTGTIDVYGTRGAGAAALVTEEGADRVDGKPALAGAELVLAGDLSGLKPTGVRGSLLGRETAEYSGPLPGTPSGLTRGLRRLVAGPYVLRREVTVPDSPGMSLRMEVTALDEGGVRPEDVRAPAPKS